MSLVAVQPKSNRSLPFLSHAGCVIGPRLSNSWVLSECGTIGTRVGRARIQARGAVVQDRLAAAHSRGVGAEHIEDVAHPFTTTVQTARFGS